MAMYQQGPKEFCVLFCAFFFGLFEITANIYIDPNSWGLLELQKCKENIGGGRLSAVLDGRKNSTPQEWVLEKKLTLLFSEVSSCGGESLNKNLRFQIISLKSS